MSTLLVPIDASQIADQDRKQQKVKVAVQSGGKVISKVIEVTGGKGEVKLDVDAKQPLVVALGPDNISDDEIFNFQTVTVNVSPNQWAGKSTLSLPPIVVTPAWWILWLRWCRTFVINGRVICADGSPVPGAEVKAFDVDFFWWWSSVQQVGPAAITDASGHFVIKFRWCCGFWPWWWWRLRSWALEPLLIEKINPVLKLNPKLKFLRPDPVPTTDIVSLTGGPTLGPLTGSTAGPVILPPIPIAGPIKDPSVLTAVRDRLIAVLPKVPDLERLRIWPWWPWTPWLDCSPDIIFRVTQNCGGGVDKVIVSENIFQTRWDIPTNLNVNLVANSEACCLHHDPPPPPGDCVVITSVCGVPVNQIGGNAGLPVPPGYVTNPIGYASPGSADRPFASVINLYGQFGSGSQADFYEIESTPHGVNAWTPVPGGSLIGFSRQYFDGTQPWPNQWFWAGFPTKPFAGKTFYESRHHYEVTHPPPNWGSPFGRSWTSNTDLLASIQTNNFFSDNAYDFRIIGYRAAGNDPDLATRKVMDGCGGQQNNLVAVRLDNRIVGAPLPGTVHVNTTEPDCGITAVRLGGAPIPPCGSQKLDPNATFEIDFFCSDSDPVGHLDHYELTLLWGLGNQRNLLALGGALTGDPGVNPGPSYGNVPPAARPVWKGGNMHLRFNHAGDVFKETCCYLIELTVRKRNIVDCGFTLPYYNQMHYTFTIIV
jgi:hypothetical protein